MPLPEAIVPIPLGAGIDDSTDAHTLQAPHAAVVSNMRPVLKGSYRKRPGWKSLYSPGLPTNPILVGGEAQCLLMGDSPARVVDTDTTFDTKFGAPYPLTLSRIPVMAGKGFVHSVQCTSSANYTAVFVSMVGDTQVDATEPADIDDLEGDFETVGVILDSADKVVWGPHRFPSALKFLPRVEAMNDGKFVFFACSGVDTATHVYMSYGEVGGAAPTVSTDLGATWTSTVNAKLYDTSTSYRVAAPSTAGKAFVAFILGVGASATLDVRSSSDGTVDDTASKALTATTAFDVTCMWDFPSLSLVVVEAIDQICYCFDLTLASDNSVAAPTLLGVTATTGILEQRTPHYGTPVLFHDHGSVVRLNEYAISIAGSAPGTPSFGAAIAEQLPMVYEPATMGTTDTLYFYGGMGTRDNTVSPMMHGANTIEVYHLATHPSFATAQPYFDTLVGESRLGDSNHKLYTWWFGTANKGPCVTGQLGTLGGILVPHCELTSTQNNRADADAGWTGAEEAGHLSNRRLTDGAGHYNDEQIVVLTRIVAGSPTYSAHPHEQSSLIATGMMSVWAVDRVAPAALRAPIIGGVTGDADSPMPGPPSTGRRILSLDVGVDPTVHTGTNELKWHVNFNYKTILVYTDATGLEYRSAPSWSLRGLQIGTGEDSNPTYCPVLDIVPHPQILAMWDTMGALDVEIFVTPRTAGDGATVADETAMYMVNRMPLQKDSVGYFVVDTLQDFVLFDVGGGAAGPWTLGHRSPPSTNAPYTDTELAAQVPPATHVLANAGEYSFAISAEDDYEMWVSKPLNKGRAPEWSPALTLLLPPASGGCVSLAGTYERVYALCRGGVWELPAIGGFAADGTGSFPPWRLTYAGDPCTNHMGTVSTPLGVFYVTSSGPRLIGQDGSVSRAGEAVRDKLAWASCTGSVFVPADSEVLWFDTSGYVAFDLKTGAWTHGDIPALSTARLGTAPIRIPATGGVLRQAAVPDDRNFLAEYRSPWLDMGDVVGFKRVVRAMARIRLENKPTTGALNITFRYNYNDTIVDTLTWAGTDIEGSGFESFLQGGPSRQKCVAIQVGVIETKTGGEAFTDIDWSLTGLGLRVRAKKGLHKIESGGRK